jgi:AcrR family transcriptional regulator
LDGGRYGSYIPFVKEIAMTTPPGTTIPRPLRRDAQRNRDRILAAGAEAFADKGADAQMDDVARRAGVGVGTVYRHFPTKEALMAELVRRKFAGIRATALEALEVEDPWDAFAGMLFRNAEMAAEDAAMRDALSRVPQAWATCQEERAEVTALAARVIERAQVAGALRADFTADDIPMLMCGICSAMAVPLPPGKDWRRHLEIVLDGLRAREVTTASSR